MRIGVDGQPLGEEPPGREQPLLSAFGLPDSPDVALAVGARARRVLDRTARPFGADGAARAVVAPALLDDALVNPLGAGARFVERAVSTLISTALAGNVGDWTEQDSRQAFTTAFGLDPPNTRGRDEILGQPFTAYDSRGRGPTDRPPPACAPSCRRGRRAPTGTRQRVRPARRRLRANVPDRGLREHAQPRRDVLAAAARGDEREDRQARS